MTSLLFSLKLSFVVATLATVLVLVVGLPLAWLLARKRFPGRQFLDVLLTLPMVLPPTVTGYYLIMLFGRNGLLGGPLYRLTGVSVMFSWWAAVLASFVVALPLMIKVSRSAIESVDENLVDVSFTLGKGGFETFRRVILPLSRNGILAGLVLAFARALGEFGATLMVAGNIPGRTDTVPLAIYSYATNGEWGQVHLMVALFTVVSGAFLLLASRLAGIRHTGSRRKGTARWL